MSEGPKMSVALGKYASVEGRKPYHAASLLEHVLRDRRYDLLPELLQLHPKLDLWRHYVSDKSVGYATDFHRFCVQQLPQELKRRALQWACREGKQPRTNAWNKQAVQALLSTPELVGLLPDVIYHILRRTRQWGHVTELGFPCHSVQLPPRLWGLPESLCPGTSTTNWQTAQRRTMYQFLVGWGVPLTPQYHRLIPELEVLGVPYHQLAQAIQFEDGPRHKNS
jgi:hypothetical protein